jgi:hypothetical protein
MTESSSKDVFLGRGPGCYRQPGNKGYRSVVKLYAADFHRDVKRSYKGQFIDNLKSKLEMQGFRFFSYSAEVEKWLTASDWEVKEKIGHDLRDFRHVLSDEGRKKRSPAKKSKTLGAGEIASHVNNSQALRTIGLKLNNAMKCQQGAQHAFTIGYSQAEAVNLVHQLKHPVEYNMQSRTGFRQIYGFHHHLAPMHVPYWSGIGKQGIIHLHPWQERYFDEDMFKAVQRNSTCKISTDNVMDDYDVSLGKLQEPTLENAAHDILEGTLSALQETILCFYNILIYIFNNEGVTDSYCARQDIACSETEEIPETSSIISESFLDDDSLSIASVDSVSFFKKLQLLG